MVLPKYTASAPISNSLRMTTTGTSECQFKVMLADWM
jgi:hypothetical protein